MAKKAAGKKNHPMEILDDNGTLVATSDAPGAKSHGGGDSTGLAKADKRNIPGPS